MESKTNSQQETIKFAAEFAKSLKAGDVVALFGDLGAGKTVFVKGLAKGLGVKAKVSSPTYVFLKIYKGKNLTINHVDLYRGEKITDFKELGLDEIFGNNDITVIEWAQRISNNLPKKRIEIYIERINEKKRRIKVVRH